MYTHQTPLNYTHTKYVYIYIWASQVVPVVKNPTTNAGDIKDEGSIRRLGRYPGGRHGNPLQYSCLENPTDRGAWWATVHMVAESDSTEATSHTHTHTHTHNGSPNRCGFNLHFPGDQ